MDEEWIHLILRGEKNLEEETNAVQDEYLNEFKRNNLKAFSAPVLEFTYKNLRELSRLLEDSIYNRSANSMRCGLIITSIRVVEALKRALELIEPSKRDGVLKKLEPDLIFVVGEKTAKQCESQLGLRTNQESSQTGSAKNLTEYMAYFLNTNKSFAPIRLLYPKGSRSDRTMETFFNHHESLDVCLESIIVYETNTVEDLHEQAMQKFNLQITPNCHAKKVVINVILFSPSGVEGYLKSDMKKFIHELKRIYTSCDKLHFKYSSIGKTTECAMKQNNLEVFCVSNKPTPSNLLASILEQTDVKHFQSS